MMALGLFLFQLLHIVIGYDDIEDVPLPPSYMEQPQQWQEQPSFRQQPGEYYDAYAQAGNADPNAGNYEQEYEQYPRFAGAMDPAAGEAPVDAAPTSAEPPPPQSPQAAPVAYATGPVSQPSYNPDPNTVPVPAEPAAHVIPLYTPPKNKHTDKDEEPFISPQWKSDEGIGNGRDPKIVAALEAITADLIGRGKELTSERNWAKQVEAMLELYKEKVANVHAHTEQIREEMKTLLKKKRQIENVEVQAELNSKLRLAQGDLEALDGAMSHVQSKADEFAEKKKKLEAQIEKINDHIKTLQHKKEGGDDETPSSSEDTTTTSSSSEHEEHTKKDKPEAEDSDSTTAKKEKETAKDSDQEKGPDKDKDATKSDSTSKKDEGKKTDEESKDKGKEKEKEKEPEKAKFRAHDLDANNLSRKFRRKHVRDDVDAVDEEELSDTETADDNN